MNGKSTITKLALIIILLVVAFLGYRFFFAEQSTTPTGLVGLSPAGLVTGQGPSDEFLTLLSSLQSINLDDLPRVLALLSGLQDFSTELAPQTPGRANPFAAIGVGGGVTVEPAASTTASSTSQ